MKEPEAQDQVPAPQGGFGGQVKSRGRLAETRSRTQATQGEIWGSGRKISVTVVAASDRS